MTRAVGAHRPPGGDGCGPDLPVLPAVARYRLRVQRERHAGVAAQRLHAAAGSGGAQNTGLKDAFLTSVGAALAATAVAVVLGSLAALAVARYRFFGRETISFLCCCRSLCPAWSPAWRCRRPSHDRLAARLRGHRHRPRHVLRGTGLQQRRGPDAPRQRDRSKRRRPTWVPTRSRPSAT